MAADLSALLREAVLQRLLATLNTQTSSSSCSSIASSSSSSFSYVGGSIDGEHHPSRAPASDADSATYVAGEKASITATAEMAKDNDNRDCVSATDAPPSLAAALLAARRKVGASGLRHRWVSSPTTQWDDIGGYTATKQQLQRALEWPQKFRVEYAHLNLSPPRGLLLYGPPGCAKTLLVKAVASSSGATFVSVSAADVYSPMVSVYALICTCLAR